MKRFLRAAFHITPFQWLLLLGSAAARYVLDASGLSGRLAQPVLFIGLAAAVWLLLAAGIRGRWQDAGHTPGSWRALRTGSRLRGLVAVFVEWGTVLPATLAFILALYWLAPTSVLLFGALLAGIILRNVLAYSRAAN